MIQTIQWTGTAARLLDQTLLPAQTVYSDITDEKQMWDAIKRLVVRGAPAIGVAAAFGVYLGIRDWPDDPDDQVAGLRRRLHDVCAYLATSRPTAVNLFWAIARVRAVAEIELADAKPPQIALRMKRRVLNEALQMLDQDTRICRAIGQHGLPLLMQNADASGRINLLTHCNAGGLATVQYGTALAPVYVGHERGVRFHVFADETRPLLQGSRITAYELAANGVPVTVICDGMAAAVMQSGRVGAVIVGTDRVAANGDVANKIGTLGVAIAARHFNIPFYVAAPTSSIDLSLATGALIPIEERDAAEITHGMGRLTAPPGAAVFNPAFDVTPNDLVSAIITEHGIARAPFGPSLGRLCASVDR